MTSQFDVIIPRRGTNSYKWDSSADPDSLPMWVADMDFRTAPAIIDALSRRVAHGVFGYTKVPDAYYAALTGWFSSRHGFAIERDWVIYTSGVVPALSAILKALTRPGERVLIQTPVYNCFFSSIANMGCSPLENALITGEDGRYAIDFDDLEAKAAEPDVHVMLLCNPHNPVGRSWSIEELGRVGDICLKHGVTVVSDEIHCDLVFPGHTHQPFATVKPAFLAASVTCSSPSKAFNIAGLQIANIVVADEHLRNRIDKAINIHEVCDVNPFGVEALIAAYSEGQRWLDELRLYLYQNYLMVKEFLTAHLPALRLTPQEATYLAWIDCRALSLTSDAIEDRLAKSGHLLINSGTLYGAAGEGFIRLNMACPRATLINGLERLRDGLQG
ncbi:MalY/PatB family protein [Cohaesibacter haloalkalitolerans]|uniref:MalY/PatB family protein n=1 Tax=Cohaesibacter haloalkalitolerans TaxID=1162980 RepID=UPI000E647D85|nr:MalY/PatB family protein [Cohaesibacter haloalkalitolerans]